MVAQLGLCLQLYNAWPGVLEAFLFDTYFKAMNSLKESQAMNLFVINTENHKQSSFNISSARLQSMNHWMYAQQYVSQSVNIDLSKILVIYL